MYYILGQSFGQKHLTSPLSLWWHCVGWWSRKDSVFVTGYHLLKSCTHRASEIIQQVKVLLHKPENPKFGIWSHCKDAMKEPTPQTVQWSPCVCYIAFAGPYCTQWIFKIYTNVGRGGSMLGLGQSVACRWNSNSQSLRVLFLEIDFKGSFVSGV